MLSLLIQSTLFRSDDTPMTPRGSNFLPDAADKEKSDNAKSISDICQVWHAWSSVGNSAFSRSALSECRLHWFLRTYLSAAFFGLQSWTSCFRLGDLTAAISEVTPHLPGQGLLGSWHFCCNLLLMCLPGHWGLQSLCRQRDTVWWLSQHLIQLWYHHHSLHQDLFCCWKSGWWPHREQCTEVSGQKCCRYEEKQQHDCHCNYSNLPACHYILQNRCRYRNLPHLTSNCFCSYSSDPPAECSANCRTMNRGTETGCHAALWVCWTLLLLKGYLYTAWIETQWPCLEIVLLPATASNALGSCSIAIVTACSLLLQLLRSCSGSILVGFLYWTSLQQMESSEMRSVHDANQSAG